jgi:hypothetical protein
VCVENGDELLREVADNNPF